MPITVGDYRKFLDTRSVSTKDSTKEWNLLSIPDLTSTPKVYGGRYFIEESDYDTFLTYHLDLNIKKNRPSGYVEKQYKDQGPLVVDIDFNYRIDCTTRLFNQSHITGIIEAYLHVLPRIFQFENDSEFSIYYMQRPHTTIDEKGGRAKDGMHFLFTFHITAEDSMYLRGQVLNEVKQVCLDLPLINTIEDVVDLAIASKRNGWPLYGSQKAGCTPYILDQVFRVHWDSEEQVLVWQRDNDPTATAIQTLNDVKNTSVRNTDIPFFTYTNEYAQLLAENEIKATSLVASGTTNHAMVARAPTMESAFECMANSQLVNLIYSRELLGEYVKTLLERWEESNKYMLCDIYKYTMALSSNFYGPGSFVKWLNVGWALKVSHEQLFVVWVAFSAQSSTFRFEDIPDMLVRWNTAKTTGFSAASIKYWLKDENPDAFYKIAESSANNRIMKLIRSGGSTDPCGDVDQAKLLYDLHGDFYVCISIRNNIWYVYEGNRWRIDEEGTQLKKRIDEIHAKFIAYEIELKMQQTAFGMNLEMLTDPKAKNPEYEKLQKSIDIIQKSAKELNKTGKRKNIMNECKDLFYKKDFMDVLDMKPMLFCFNNGVIDFERKEFRKGRPDDYLSVSCGYNYDASLLDERTNGQILMEIRKFFRDIYPVEDTREYVWDHLASVLIGEICQTFHMYWGGGSNGKTKILELMTLAMGEYSHTIPISLISEERAKIGSVSPEVVELRAKRWGTIFEPSQKMVVEEGPFKQITGGDPQTGRGLYMQKTVTFIPQITVVVCTNYDLQFRTTDNGTWRRIRKIPHTATFVEGPPTKLGEVQADLNISQKFPIWVDTFLALLVQRAFNTGGRVPMRETIRLATTKMRKGQDLLSEFSASRLSVCLPGDSQYGITKAQLTAEYTNWRKENYNINTNKIDITNLHEYVTSQYGEFNASTSSWQGIKINHAVMMDIGDFVSSEGDEDSR